MSTGAIVALAVVIGAYGFLVLESSAEAAIANLSRSRARLLASRDPEDRRTQVLLRLVLNREDTFGSFAMGRSAAVATGLTAAIYLVIREAGFDWQTVILTGAVALVAIALAQAVPRRLAAADVEGFALRLAGLMDRLDILFLVPEALFEAPVALWLRMRRASAAPREPEPLEILLNREEEGEGIEAEEEQMLRGIIQIGETPVREAMVPRPDIIAVEVGTALRDAARVVVNRGISRMPVYEGTLDNIVGVVYAKDILARLLTPSDGEETPLRTILRPPVLVPESKRVDQMLAEFRKSRVHMAIILDEYGSTAGLVTIEDLLEEIVGEIEDEYDHTPQSVVPLSADEALLDGRAPADALQDLFGVDVGDGDFDTVGGLIFDRLGRIPDVGDELQLGALRLRVLSMDGRRIARVRAYRPATPAASSVPGAPAAS